MTPLCICSRKKDGNIFLVAFYECEDDFDLEELDNDHLYCSKNRWIGVRPRCLPIGDGDKQEDYDGDGGDEDEDADDDNDNETGNEDGDGMYADARNLFASSVRLMTSMCKCVGTSSGLQMDGFIEKNRSFQSISGHI